MDCFVCNAVLEHVENPQLCVYEMFRTLVPGGQIWVEVPFIQFYHPHPNDYYRWTSKGLEMLMKDFQRLGGGVGVLSSHEVHKIASHTMEVNQEKIYNRSLDLIKNWFEEYDSTVKKPRIYSTTYFWGEKNTEIPVPKGEYMEWCKNDYESRHMIPYTSNQKLTRNLILKVK